MGFTNASTVDQTTCRLCSTAQEYKVISCGNYSLTINNSAIVHNYVVVDVAVLAFALLLCFRALVPGEPLNSLERACFGALCHHFGALVPVKLTREGVL